MNDERTENFDNSARIYKHGRKHRRTRFNKVCFSATTNHVKLGPGLYRIHRHGAPACYVGSFIINSDHTIEFYGHNLIIEKD